MHTGGENEAAFTCCPVALAAHRSCHSTCPRLLLLQLSKLHLLAQKIFYQPRCVLGYSLEAIKSLVTRTAAAKPEWPVHGIRE